MGYEPIDAWYEEAEKAAYDSAMKQYRNSDAFCISILNSAGKTCINSKLEPHRIVSGKISMQCVATETKSFTKGR